MRVRDVFKQLSDADMNDEIHVRIYANNDDDLNEEVLTFTAVNFANRMDNVVDLICLPALNQIGYRPVADPVADDRDYYDREEFLLSTLDRVEVNRPIDSETET